MRSSFASLEKLAAALEVLKRDQRRLQLNHFLDRFDIEDAKIEGIRDGRKQILASYGIETAEDVSDHLLRKVPGFAPKMISRLMTWRRSIEAKFVFDPAKSVDPRDILRINREFQATASGIVTAAKAAYLDAVTKHAQILTMRQSMRPRLEALNLAAERARVDLDYVSRS